MRPGSQPHLLQKVSTERTDHLPFKSVCMAAMAACTRFQGLRPIKGRPVQSKQAMARVAPRRQAHVVRAGAFLGSTTNLIMIASTTAFLAAGRFGLAPTSNAFATAGLKLTPQNSGLKSGDPSGFTAVDTLALGAMGHVVGVGLILGLKVPRSSCRACALGQTW